MFRKDFKIKTNVKTKSSEKRKLVSDISNYYHTDPLLLTNLFGKLDMHKIKVECHDETILTIFNFDDQPLFFEYNKIIIPTVYCLWALYDILPSFTIYEETSSYIKNGSDLMIPGIIVDISLKEKCYGVFKKNELYTINTTKSRAPMAIGLTNMDGYDMFMAARRGKALNVIHFEGDCLWAFGKQNIKPYISWDDNTLSTVDNDENELENVDVNTNISDENKKIDEVEDGANNNDDVSISEKDIANVTNMDDLLESCFLHALKLSIKDRELPMSLNTLYASNVLRYCPDGQLIDIKKTSFKKFGVFMKAMQQQGLLTLKTLSKGVDALNTVDRSHEKLRFTPSLTFQEEKKSAQEGEYVFPKIEEIYFVTDKAYSVMKFGGFKKSDVASEKEIKSIVTDYVNKNNLHGLTKEMVNLDDVLKSCCLNSKEKITELSWRTLFERIHKNMTPGIVLRFPNQDVVVKNSKKPKIKIQSFNRNNKMVTRIEGEHLFCIDSKKLCTVIQQAIGCSCGMVADKTGAAAVQAQGDQKQRVTEILMEQFKVPLSYIEGAVLKKSK